MNCQNCGAPMKLVRDRDYFVCDYCTTFYFPEPSKDEVRNLEELTNIQCPICKNQLSLASIEGNRALLCENCRGILIDQWVFAFAVQYLRAHTEGPDIPPRQLDAQELSRLLRCPHCGQSMDTYPYAGPGNIVIDCCCKCKLIWLDYGELYKVIHAAGRDRGHAIKDD